MHTPAAPYGSHVIAASIAGGCTGVASGGAASAPPGAGMPDLPTVHAPIASASAAIRTEERRRIRRIVLEARRGRATEIGAHSHAAPHSAPISPTHVESHAVSQQYASAAQIDAA